MKENVVNLLCLLSLPVLLPFLWCLSLLIKIVRDCLSGTFLSWDGFVGQCLITIFGSVYLWKVGQFFWFLDLNFVSLEEVCGTFVVTFSLFFLYGHMFLNCLWSLLFDHFIRNLMDE